MISKKNRKKTAVYLFIVFVLSRIADMITTWYYTPDLMLEGNSIYYAQSWDRIITIQAVVIVLLMYYFYRIAMADYNKALQGEWLIKKIVGERFSTPIKRYTYELSVLIALTIAGFIAVSLWHLGHGLRLDSVNYFLGLKIGNLPLSIPVVLLLPWIISYNLLDRYFAKKYTQSH